MVEKKTIGISALAGILATLLVIGGVNMFDDKTYYCQDENSIRECPGGLSGGQGTRCYEEDKGGWDYCSSGWIEVVDDTVRDQLDYDREAEKYICRTDGTCERI